jgi:hypothetical protein
MTTPAQPLSPDQKSGLLLAISQLDMLLEAFGNAPDRVKAAAKEFKEALNEWANGPKEGEKNA